MQSSGFPTSSEQSGPPNVLTPHQLLGITMAYQDLNNLSALSTTSLSHHYRSSPPLLMTRHQILSPLPALVDRRKQSPLPVISPKMILAPALKHHHNLLQRFPCRHSNNHSMI